MSDVHPHDINENTNDSIQERARQEWKKFEKVAALLKTVDDYMAVYNDLKEANELFIIGSEGEKHPTHNLPPGHTSETWNELPQSEQYSAVLQTAQQTEPYMVSLGKQLTEMFGIEFHQGPMKGEERVMEKRDNDYQGDILRVVDMVRCSMIMDSLYNQAKKIVDSFREGPLSEEWELVRIKDGFEKAESFLVGGYRDIKVNVRSKATGHIVEMQLHLLPYYQLKHHGGHDHYKFARQQRVQGITRASDILDGSMLLETIAVGVEELEKEDAEFEKATIMERLGDLNFEAAQTFNLDQQYQEKAAVLSKSVYYYDQALRIVLAKDISTIEEAPLRKKYEALRAEVSIGISQGLNAYDYVKDHVNDFYPDSEIAALPALVRPEMNDWENDYGIDDVVSEISSSLGERHPLCFTAKVIKTDVMGKGSCVPYGESLVEEMRGVLGFDHPMILNTLVCAYEGSAAVEDEIRLIGKIMDVLEINVIRLGIDHQLIFKILRQFTTALDEETTNWMIDEPGCKISVLADIVDNPRWQNERSPANRYMKLIRSMIHRTVNSIDADKIIVGSRVLVWCWKYQGYYSGEVTDKREGTIFVQFDDNTTGWISTLRRHTLLLSHGEGEPAAIPPRYEDGAEVGHQRYAFWCDTPKPSFYTGKVKELDENSLTVSFGWNLDDLEGPPESVPHDTHYFPVEGRESVSLESVKTGDMLYVYWSSFYTWWLGEVLGPTSDGPNCTVFEIQYFSGDIQVCDLNKMPFCSARNPFFDFIQG